MKAATMAFVLMAAAAICLVPADMADAEYYDISGDAVIGTGDDAEYQITYINDDYNDTTEYPNMNMSVSYTASLVDSSGSTVSNGVSPSSGSIDSGIATTLTVSAPDDAGRYTLKVSYDVSVSYTETGEDGETEEVTEDLDTEDSFSIRVVEPVTLSVTLTNTSDIDLNGYEVYFVVDGERMEDSLQSIDIAQKGETTVTYEWVTDAGNGQHTFSLEAADNGKMADIEGLGDTHTFYIGDSSYTWLVALLVVVLIVVILAMVWVYRKPVKNYGKPKSRR